MRIILLLLIATLPAAAQDFSELKVERVASGFRFTEGPAWSPKGFLLFSDVPNNRIHKYTPGEAATVFREDSGGANGNVFDERGRLYTCEGEARRLTRTDPDGAVEVLAERFEGMRLNAPNDVTVRRDGHIYFTDPAYGKQTETRELPFYGVYHVTPKGELEVIARMEQRPNGITLSPNGRVLYVAGADERVVRAYDLDRNGRASNPRLVITGIEGVPDGIRTDAKGNIYVACQGVAVYTPEGKLRHMIPIPETPANLEFGDADGQTLYITARRSLYRVRLDVKGSSHR